MLYGGCFNKGPERGRVFATASSGTNEGNVWLTDTMEVPSHVSHCLTLTLPFYLLL